MVPLTFDPLPLGSITPGGWLRGELEAEAAGLAGHEYDFYAWVRDSSWMGGGEEYSGLNEGGDLLVSFCSYSRWGWWFLWGSMRDKTTYCASR